MKSILKHKVLKNKKINIKDKTGLSVTSQHPPYKNPDLYNGEALANNGVTLKNTHNKQVFIESSYTS